MPWILAKERLPKDGHKRAAKQNGNYLSLRVIEGEVIKVGNFTVHSIEILEEWFPGIEWLDESEPDQDNLLWDELFEYYETERLKPIRYTDTRNSSLAWIVCNHVSRCSLDKFSIII